jgi:alanine racemase
MVNPATPLVHQSTYGDTYRGTFAEIDTNALVRNVRYLAKLANAPICIPLKANAYGHDMLICASALEGESCVLGYGVATLSEGIELRMQGFTKIIWLFEGVASASELQLAQYHQLTVVIHHPNQLSWLETANVAIDIWLKFDTDMHRLGLDTDKAEFYINKALGFKNCSLVGLMSHYACADIFDSVSNYQQTEKMHALQSLATSYGIKTSFANSAALLRSTVRATDTSENHCIIGDIARPGISSYGISPFAEHSAQALNLKPVMRLFSKIIAIRTLDKNESVGYGGTWQAEEPCQIATLCIGYGDGFCRETPYGIPVAISKRDNTSTDREITRNSEQKIENEKIIGKLAGRVSMDMITVQFSIDAEITCGDYCILLGPPAFSAEALANHQSTIPYTVTTQLTQRVVRLAHQLPNTEMH